ncbi:hypothetical protein NDU88_007318 [Pleurodeles waltl]|uniref:Uncharacterized protein n=1 Tax=Pleurodeles waltl TaxID=8319 RepID=A0AAV7VQE1_PLEWA|nr:hypothetical protein NDU88_007318 [Pleurodeles waltl]
MSGTLYSEMDGNGKTGMAQIRLYFWQPWPVGSQSGCDGTHALGGHEEQLSSRRLGRQACNQRMPIGVGAPSGYQREERARPGASCPTSGDAFGLGLQEVHQVVPGEPSTSRGVGFAEQEYELEEEVLNYEDGDEAVDGEIVQQRAVQKGIGDQWEAN